MAYKVTGEGYSAFFREEEDGREVEADDIEDGYTCLLCNTSYEKGNNYQIAYIYVDFKINKICLYHLSFICCYSFK